MAAVRSVLFDWDGTLAREQQPGFRTGISAAAKVAGVDGEALRVAFREALPAYSPGRTTKAIDARDVLESALARLSAGRPNDHMLAASAEAFAGAALSVYQLYDDARAALASLCYRGFRVGVVTNSIFPGATFSNIAPSLGIAGYVGAFVSSVDAGHGKPHRAPYRLAAERLGVGPSETLFVGDRLDTDIAGALDAGMRAVLIDRGGQPGLHGEVSVIASLAGLAAILGEGTAPA